MRTAVRRLQSIQNHIMKASTRAGLHSSPNLVVTPTTSLVDQKVHIRLHGLEPNQMIRLVARVRENSIWFESSGLFRASDAGEVDLNRDPSLGGTYTGNDPMGLFWSLEPCPGQGSGIRLVKKDVASPMEIDLTVLREANEVKAMPDVIARAKLERFYMKPGVKRIPIKEGRFRGTVFIPEGSGPFPAVTDMFGGVVSLIETRAALLASHGFAVFAIAYLYTDHLPQNLMGADDKYIQAAAEWFFSQPYVDSTRVGAVGLCFGGCLSLMLAARMPMIRAAVNINGIPIVPGDTTEVHSACRDGSQWPSPNRVYKTSEGVSIDDVYDCDNPTPIPAWCNGAKVLSIVGEDDKQVHPKWHFFYRDHWPEVCRDNLEFHSYPGAGHLIEPPYAPHVRAVRPSKERIQSIDFLPQKYHDLLFMCGGYPVQHAFAQEDSWNKVLNFLRRELGS